MSARMCAFGCRTNIAIAQRRYLTWGQPPIAEGWPRQPIQEAAHTNWSNDR